MKNIFLVLLLGFFLLDNLTLAEIPEPLCYWKLNGDLQGKLVDSSGNGYDTSAGEGAEFTPSPFGESLRLPSGVSYGAKKTDGFDQLHQVTIAAWVKPRQFTRFNGIFCKDDGDNRIIFTFKDYGRVLMLGVSIGRYWEADASIQPENLADGRWHFVAGSYDGEAYRIYIDGKLVKEFWRRGRMIAGGKAPLKIGKARRFRTPGGEFNGGLAELQVFPKALTGKQITELWEKNAPKVEAFNKQHLAKATKSLNFAEVNAKTFSETVIALQKHLSEKNFTPSAIDPLLDALQNKYPAECYQLTHVTKLLLADFVSPRQNFVTHIERLMPRYLEYLPLTPQQWAQQTPEQRKHWEAVKKLKHNFETLKKEVAKSGTGYWPHTHQATAMLIAMAPHILDRPHIREGVAPFVADPQTPETKQYTQAEADAMLQADWLFQADGKPSIARIRQEIDWTRQLAKRFGGDFSRQLKPLDVIEKKLASLPPEKLDKELYFAVRKIKREIFLSNPAIDFKSLLFVDGPLPQGSAWYHEARHRLSEMSMPGGRLLVLDGLNPNSPIRQLAPQAPLHGAFWRPDVSFDGKKILFCFRPHNEKSFHLYEIDADGKNLRQITFGNFTDLDPIYLPDGKILFSTTRAQTYVRCMPPTNGYVLARCDTDGKNLYILSRNSENDYLPSVMQDGRVIYTRWEYTDKPLWRAQSLWTMNPDGTQVSVYWGNQSVWPDLLKDARSIPGTSSVMFNGSAHHNWFAGCVGKLDVSKGRNFPEGLTKVTADIPWPESGDGPTDPLETKNYHASGKFLSYYSPYPLSEKDFLVSASPQLRGGPFSLYLMDTDGNRELIYRGAHNIFHAIPLAAREKPPVLPDRVEWPTWKERLTPKPGYFFSNNVYEGVPKELVGKAKYLRVMNIIPKTYTFWDRREYTSGGPTVSLVQTDGVKNIIGTVEIEKDGSVSFEAPSGMALHFQLLDENYCALQTMRSFTGVMPGEQRGCTGCHALGNIAPPSMDEQSAALRQAPQKITPPPWEDRTVDFQRYVQPVLDKYCGECHQGEGKAKKTLDLTSRTGWRNFKAPYRTLIGAPTWNRPYVPPKNPPPGFGIAKPLFVEGFDQRDPVGYTTPKPMTRLSYASPLIEIARTGKHPKHPEMRFKSVDAVSLRRLITWIDAMCPYYGEKEVRSLPDPDFPGVEWLPVRPRIKTAPVVVRPGPFQ